MPEIGKNQGVRQESRAQLDKAIELLTALFDEHTSRGTYGKAGVEIAFEAGKALYVRRTLEATHK